MANTTVDLSSAEVLDSHCHPFRLNDLLTGDLAAFDTRMMFHGESMLSSSRLDPGLSDQVDRLTDTTVYGIAIRRWLSQRLGCEDSRKAVATARARALTADPVGYIKGLLDSERVVGVLADEGHPQPPVPAVEFAAAIGVPVHRVARIEPWIIAHREGSFDDLVSGLESEMAGAAADPNCVAFKSIIAYRTGLDVTDPTPVEASAGFARWRNDQWRESRLDAKPVRDFLLRRAMAVAAANDRPFHIHCGGGDPDINLEYAKPAGLFPLLIDMQRQPVVLVHSGWPWVVEAAYVSSVLPNVFLEISELVPWGWSQVEWALEMIVGTVPVAKVFYGSDEAAEPEAFWASARLVRGALGRVLSRFVDNDYLGLADATRLGELVLAGASRQLHGIA
jgi:hypothetical protein